MRRSLIHGAILALLTTAALAGERETLRALPADAWPLAACAPEPVAPEEPQLTESPDCIEDTGEPSAPDPEQEQAFFKRLLGYAHLALKHRVSGLASYYASFFDGRKTANGETFRNAEFSAAHRTLPLGTWVEVRSRATGRTLRLKVNDRGPFTKKFVLDLSQSAARFLGVDIARDRHVEIRVIALPGEEPPPANIRIPGS